METGSIVALPQYGELYPDRYSGVRDALAWFVGEATIAAIDASTLSDLIDTAVCGRIAKPDIARWVQVLPEGTVNWPPEFSAWAESHGATHESLIRCLIGAAVSRSLALFQAGRRRSALVQPLAVFRAEGRSCRPECKACDGLALPTQCAARHWQVIFGCRQPFCGCSVRFADDRVLAHLVGMGVPIHSMQR